MNESRNDNEDNAIIIMMMITTIFNYFRIIDNRLVSWITAAVSGDQGTYVRDFQPRQWQNFHFVQRKQWNFFLFQKSNRIWLFNFILSIISFMSTYLCQLTINIFECYFYFWFFSIPLGPMVNNPWLRIYEWDSNFIPTGNNMQNYEFS